MKQIIIGQLMLWGNLGTLLLGYFIVKPLEVSTFVEVMACILGVASSVFNVIMAINVQMQGYNKLNIKI